MKIKKSIGNSLFAVIFTLLFTVCASTPVHTPAITPEASVLDDLSRAIRDVSDYLNNNIPAGSMIAFINIQSESEALSGFIIDDLTANAVNDRNFTVVDRQQLEVIRAEQNLHLSGDVDDATALSIGRFLGAQTIVSGWISSLGGQFRLTIRALDVETARVQGQYNQNIGTEREIIALIGGGRGQMVQAPMVQTQTPGQQVVPPPVQQAVSTVTSVLVSPNNISVDKGRIQQFEAMVSGTNDPDQTVTWTISGNISRGTIISEDGILTVADDEVATPLTVTATSTVDWNRSASVTVIIPGGISAIDVTNVATWNTAINRIRNGGNNQTYIINVIGNISVPLPPHNENLFGSLTGISVTLQGNGTITPASNGNLLRIGAGQMVIVRGNISLRGRSNIGTHDMSNGSVVLIGTNGYFRMEGNASITGNTVRGVGGGVYVNGGNFTMEGGTISDNIAWVGGGVFVDSVGTFTMEGGTISGNTTSHHEGGGGVALGGRGLAAPQSRGIFVMRGGTISGNTSNNGRGGGVSANWFDSIFTMEGGTISGNITSGEGGGVFINGGSRIIFTKTGGTINGNDTTFGNRNTARQQGHAVSEGSHWRNATAGPDDTTSGFGFFLND